VENLNNDKSFLVHFIRDLGARGLMDILKAVVNLMIVTLVARQLSGDDYGVYTQLTTFVAVLVPVLLLRLNTACVRFFPSVAEDIISRGRHFSSVTLLVLGFTSLCAAVVGITAEFSSKMLFGEILSFQIILVLALYLVIRSTVTLFTEYYRAVNRTIRAGVINTIRLLLMLGAVVLSVLRDFDVLGILRAQLAAEAMVAIVLAIWFARERVLIFSRNLRLAEIKPYLVYSLPLVPYSMLMAINQFADRYFITHMVGLSDAGVYSLNSNIIAAAFLINFSLSYVIYPHLSHLWESGDMNAVRDMLQAGQRVFVFFALPIATGVTLVYKPLLGALVGDQYLLTLSSVVFICLGQIMLGLCAICSFTIDLSKATAMYLKILVGTAALNLLLNALAVPSFGVAGAAGATATTYFIQFLFMWNLSARLLGFKRHPDLGFIALCAVGTGIMWAALQFLGPVESLLDIGLTVLAGASVYGVVSVLLFRRQMSVLAALFRRK